MKWKRKITSLLLAWSLYEVILKSSTFIATVIKHATMKSGNLIILCLLTYNILIVGVKPLNNNGNNRKFLNTTMLADSIVYDSCQ